MNGIFERNCHRSYNKAQNIFAFWFAFSFVLNGYSSGLPGVSLGSIVFAVLIIFTFFESKIYIRNNSALIYFCLTVITSTLGLILNNSSIASIKSIVIAIAKLLLWSLMASIVANKKYNFIYIYKWFRIIGMIMILYLLMQNIAFYGYDVFLPNIFNFSIIKPFSEGYADYLGDSPIIRPAAFLSESAFLGNYLMCWLALSLKNASEKRNMDIREPFIISLSIILSSSTSAIICFPVIWLLYWSRFPTYLKFRIILFALFGSGLLITLFICIPSILSGDFISSFQYALEKLGRIKESARIGKSFLYLKGLPIGVYIFGVGLGNYIPYLQNIYKDSFIYLNSICTILIQSGTVGIILFITFYLNLLIRSFIHHNRTALALLFIYFIKGFASGMFFSTYGVLFIFIICGELSLKNKWKIDRREEIELFT